MKESYGPEGAAPPDAHQRLLEAAQDEFAERGYDGATIRDICTKAGANVASVNYYFGGKEGLYIAAVKYAHTCSTQMDRLPEADPDTPPLEKLKSFIRQMVARMHGPASPSAMKLVMREMADPGKAAHVVIAEFIKPMAFYLFGILGELLPHLDTPHRMAAGFSVIGQILYYRQNRRVSELIFGKEAVDSLDLALVTDHVTRFTLAALGLAEPLTHPQPPPP